ncbi:Outer membrane protein TolC [Arenibacter nanhaiticus]|uniref:Outer membrane protein TolC n=1 Tax=Arenibacter nanhaiticus TaxID=558155 RepID=A0A1M6CRM7_9FLAO|nr:TolC family protein [Arenibacter nanhaiticus]SHI63636.1 Outer membrane protein TolC [Arenibacter nanhaiticus]
MRTHYKYHTSKGGLLFAALLLTISVQSQDLGSLVMEAYANNPDIKAFELQYQVAIEKTKEVNALPNTTMEAMVLANPPENIAMSEMAQFEVMQMFPWFKTITARENYASSLAEAQYEDIAIAKRKLAASVSQSYYALFANQGKQKVLVENIALLKTYETLALNALEVGKASAVDVLRLQMRQNELLALKKVLEQEYLSEQSQLNSLLNRDKNTPVLVTIELDGLSEELPYDANNLQLHPELLKYDKLFKSVTQSELLNQKESAPMLGLGMNYTIMGMHKNMVMPMVSLSIPIFNNSFKSKSRQNEIKQQEIIVQKQSKLNTLEAVLDKAVKARKAARINYEIQAQNLAQAKNAEEILLKSYETGTIDFRDVLEVQELQLKFQTGQIEAMRDFQVQSTIIHYLSK